MKYIKLMVLALVFALASSVNAQEYIDGIINQGATGTTSATVIVPPGRGYAQITDLSARTDAGNTSSTIDIMYGDDVKYPVTSATAASGTVLWLNNASPTRLAVSDYIIYQNAANGTYTINRVTVSAAASVTLQTAITPATTVNDFIWSVATRIRRPIVGVGTVSTTVATGCNLWLPANVPSVLVLEGNTTSCQLSVSGQRSLMK